MRRIITRGAVSACYAMAALFAVGVWSGESRAAVANVAVDIGGMITGCVSGNNPANDCANNVTGGADGNDNANDTFTFTPTNGTGATVTVTFAFNPVIDVLVDAGGPVVALNSGNPFTSFSGLSDPFTINLERDGGGRIEYKIVVTPLPAAALLFLGGLGGLAGVGTLRRFRRGPETAAA